MCRHDVYAAGCYDRHGSIRNNAYPVFAVPLISFGKTNAEICTVFRESIAICSVWTPCGLLFEKCQPVYRKPWDTGSNLHSASRCIAFVEKADAAFYSRGNRVLYAFGAIYFLVIYYICITKWYMLSTYARNGGKRMEMLSLMQELKENAYPGRGIVIGRSADGKKAVTAYFIMGRSSNSRNRVFVTEGEGIRTQAFDPSKLEDPSLIIYAPVRVLGNKTIVTNGDQTDTIYDGLKGGLTFEQSLQSREFEPDGPNYTPRISGVMYVENGRYGYSMSILKSNNGNPDACIRYTYSYENPVAGEGRFIHTYMHDGNPLPSFEGEPKLVEIRGDIEEFTKQVWEHLNEENKVSLFVRFIDIETGVHETRIMNKNGGLS